jgi:hypothetical protein
MASTHHVEGGATGAGISGIGTAHQLRHSAERELIVETAIDGAVQSSTARRSKTWAIAGSGSAADR